jgi:PhoH-like ATPase
LTRHIYILDTCVLLHDPKSIENFAEHDVYIPLAVIDDLDAQKSDIGSRGYNARAALRAIGEFDILALKDYQGVPIGDKGGKLYLHNSDRHALGEKPQVMKRNSDDDLILSAQELQKDLPKRKVCIVSKDLGLRLRAMGHGCLAENYESDQLDDAFTGIRRVTVEFHKDWEALSTVKADGDGYKRVALTSLTKTMQAQLADMSPNEFVVFLRGEGQENAAIYKVPSIDLGAGIPEPYLKILRENNAYKYSGIKPLNLEQKMAMEALSDYDIPFVAVCGKAGTGKTMATLAVGLEKVYGGTYDKIIVIKPLIPVGGKDIGFLPGSKNDKISAWLGPMRDNLEMLITKRSDAKGRNMDQEASDALDEMIQDGIIEVEAMTFIQGRSIMNTLIIIDESQNLTAREARMAVERCGKNSKIVFLGDLSQIENPYLDKRSSGLAHAVIGGKFSGLCASLEMVKVERSPLAAAADQIFGPR